MALPRSPLRTTTSPGTSSRGRNRRASARDFSGTEAGEHVELSEQILGAQPEIERRELIHQQAERLVLPLKILEHLLSDQPLVVEIVKS